MRLLLVLFAILISTPAVFAGDDGSVSYNTRCSVCHGSKGDGNGQLASEMPKRPTNFADCETMSRVSDTFLSEVIKRGTGAMHLTPAMPSWQYSFRDDEVRALIQYIRGFCRP